MMLPVKKYYDFEEHKLDEQYEVFSHAFFEKHLLIFLSHLGDLYKAIQTKANRKELMRVYVIGFRSILGIGIALKAKDDISLPNIQTTKKDIERLLFDVYEKTLDLRYTLQDRTFYSMFSSYLVLGNHLGFNFDDITYVYEKEMGE